MVRRRFFHSFAPPIAPYDSTLGPYSRRRALEIRLGKEGAQEMLCDVLQESIQNQDSRWSKEQHPWVHLESYPSGL